MGSVHCLVLWKQHNGQETEYVPVLWDKSGEAPPQASERNTCYPFPKLCVVFVTLELIQSPEMQQNSAVRVLQNWPVYLYKFTSSIFSPDINIKSFGANDKYSDTSANKWPC